MSIFYLRPEVGSDAADGTSWANAWKTIKDGATAGRTAPGDEIRIEKSPDPVSLGSATWASNSATVTLAAPATTNVPATEAAWTSADGTNVECDTTSQMSLGSYRPRIKVKSGFTTGLAAYFAFSATDFSAYQKISFYFDTNVAIAANSLQIALCSDNAGATPVDTFTLDFAMTDKGTFVTLNKGSALGASIQSVALYVLIDLGGSDVTVSFDNMFAANSLHLRSVIGKGGGEPYFSIKYINETDVRLGSLHWWYSADDIKYGGASGSATAYARETLRWPTNGDSGSNCPGLIQESGTDMGSGLISYLGGWNVSTTEQDGHSWFMAIIVMTDQYQAFVDPNGKDFCKLEKIGMAQNQGAVWHARNGGGNSWVLKDLEVTGDYGCILRSAYQKCTNHRLEGTWRLSGRENRYFIRIDPTPFFGSLFGDADFIGSGSGDYATVFYFQFNYANLTGKVTIHAGSGSGYTTALDLRVSEAYFGEMEIIFYNASAGDQSGIYVSDKFANLEIGKLTVGGYMRSALWRRFGGTIRIGNYEWLGGASLTNDIYSDGGIDSNYSQGCYRDLIAFDRYKATDRWKCDHRQGIVSDHITGGQSSGWGCGGTGLSMLMNPNSQAYPLVQTFYVPITGTQAQKIHMQVIKTSSGANCTLKANITGCGVSILQESVTLTDSWAEYLSTSFTPAHKGFVRVDLFALDGSTTGDIGIDDIHIADA